MISRLPPWQQGEAAGRSSPLTSWLFANATERADGQSQRASFAPSHHKTPDHPKAGEQPSVWALHEHFYRLAVGPSSLKKMPCCIAVSVRLCEVSGVD